MIQRIQSVYILISLALQVLQLQLTWITFRLGDAEFKLRALGLNEDLSSVWPLTLFVLISVLLSILSLGTFKNRKVQMKWTLAAFATSMLTPLVFWMVSKQAQNLLFQMDGHPGNAMEMQYHLTVIFPLIAAALLFMARKAIGKDEELVRSADRIR